MLTPQLSHTCKTEYKYMFLIVRHLSVAHLMRNCSDLTSADFVAVNFVLYCMCGWAEDTQVFIFHCLFYELCLDCGFYEPDIFASH